MVGESHSLVNATSLTQLLSLLFSHVNAVKILNTVLRTFKNALQAVSFFRGGVRTKSSPCLDGK